MKTINETIIINKHFFLKKKECHSSCLTCSGVGENDCLSCETSFYYENGGCVSQCSIGFYQNDNSHTCNSCPSICLACTSRILSFQFFDLIFIFSFHFFKKFLIIIIFFNSNDGICSRISFLFFSYSWNSPFLFLFFSFLIEIS